MRRAVSVIVFVLIAAACADDSGGQSTSTSTDGGSSAAPAPQAGPVSIEVDDSAIGEVLVDGDGMSLYVFLPDTADDIFCLDECRDTWTPVLIEGRLALADGLDRSLFSRRALDDGSKQLAVDGQPVYRYTGDVEAGDQNGQGVDTLWFMVKPSGLRNVATQP